MKTKILLAGFAAVCLAWISRGAPPEIECSGVLVAGAETRVALASKGTAPAQWILVGREFNGFVVAAYDAKTGFVTLTRADQEFRIPLKEAHVAAGAVEPPPAIKQAILGNLRQLAAAADQYYLENGRSTVPLAELVGPSRYVRVLESKAGEDYRQIKFAQGQKLSVTTADGATISYEP